jgi:Domain of unknown function (DUF4190)
MTQQPPDPQAPNAPSQQLGTPPYPQTHSSQPYYAPPPSAYPQAPAGQPYYGGPTAPPRNTNGLAIAAMVLGIIWVYWVGSILALIFGYVARKQIREKNQNGDGMAIAGIVLGWIGVGTLVLVIVIAIAGASSGPSSGY